MYVITWPNTWFVILTVYQGDAREVSVLGEGRLLKSGGNETLHGEPCTMKEIQVGGRTQESCS